MTNGSTESVGINWDEVFSPKKSEIPPSQTIAEVLPNQVDSETISKGMTAESIENLFSKKTEEVHPISKVLDEIEKEKKETEEDEGMFSFFSDAYKKVESLIKPIAGVVTGSSKDTEATKASKNIYTGNIMKNLPGKQQGKMFALTVTGERPESIADMLVEENKTAFDGEPLLKKWVDDKDNIFLQNLKTNELERFPAGFNIDTASQLYSMGMLFGNPTVSSIMNMAKGGFIGKVATGSAIAGLAEHEIQDLQKRLGGTLDKDEIYLAAVLGGSSEVASKFLKLYRDLKISKSADENKNISDMMSHMRESIASSKYLEETLDVDAKLPAYALWPTSKVRDQLKIIEGHASLRDSLAREFRTLNEKTRNIITSVIGKTGHKVANPQEQFNSAFKGLLKEKSEARKIATEKLYKEASAENINVNLNLEDVFKKMKDLKTPDFNRKIKGTILDKSLKDVEDMLLMRPTKNQIDLYKKEYFEKTGRKLKDVKIIPVRNLDDVQEVVHTISKMTDKVTDFPLDKKTRSRLIDIRKSLLEHLDGVSDKFKKANNLYRKMSIDINDMNNSVLSGMDNLNPHQYSSIEERIFSSNVDMAEKKKAKLFLDKHDPNIWKNMVRKRLEDNFESSPMVSKELESKTKIVGQEIDYNNMRTVAKDVLEFMESKEQKNLVKHMSAGDRETWHIAKKWMNALSVEGSRVPWVEQFKDVFYRPIRATLAITERVKDTFFEVSLLNTLTSPTLEAQRKLIGEATSQTEKMNIFREMIDKSSAMVWKGLEEKRQLIPIGMTINTSASEPEKEQ